MKLFKKAILSLLVANSLIVAPTNGAEIPEFPSHTTVSAPSYSERFGQSVKYLSEQVGRTVYRHRGVLTASAVISTVFLSTYYYLSMASDSGMDDANMMTVTPNITGICPTSFPFEDIFNQTLRGCNGLPLVFDVPESSWWYTFAPYNESCSTKESLLTDIQGTSVNQLYDFLRSFNGTWSDRIDASKDWVTTAYDALGNFYCSCHYQIHPNVATCTSKSVAISLRLPSVPNVHGLGLNADGTIQERVLGVLSGLSGGADDGIRCPAIVHGNCQL